jgi:hypothetical protein
MVVTALQFGSWPVRYRLQATEFDGLAAENRLDVGTGRFVRFVDGAGGKRAALLLVDEYFPAGALRIDMTVQRSGQRIDPSTALFRVVVAELDGKVACEHTLPAASVDQQALSAIRLSCRLGNGGPTTFTVETLGAAPLLFGHVRFVWKNLTEV